MLAVVALVAGWSPTLHAEEAKKTSGSITLKNNWSDPQGGPGAFSQTVSLFVQTPSWLGLAGDFTYQSKGDYVAYAPFLTLNAGPHYLLLGYSADNVGKDFVQVGYWHLNQYAGFKVIADIRAYVAANEKSQGFLDSYLEVGRNVLPELKVSLVVDDVYAFDGAANTVLLGPLVCYKATKQVSFIGRYLHAWSDSDASGTSQADKFRLAIQYSF